MSVYPPSANASASARVDTVTGQGLSPSWRRAATSRLLAVFTWGRRPTPSRSALAASRSTLRLALWTSTTANGVSGSDRVGVAALAGVLTGPSGLTGLTGASSTGSVRRRSCGRPSLAVVVDGRPGHPEQIRDGLRGVPRVEVPVLVQLPYECLLVMSAQRPGRGGALRGQLL